VCLCVFVCECMLHTLVCGVCTMQVNMYVQTTVKVETCFVSLTDSIHW